MAGGDWTVERHLAGKPPGVVELYQRFAEQVSRCGPHDLSVTKTAIVFKGPVRGFAGVTPKQSRLVGFLDLTRQVKRHPITTVKSYTATLWVHRFALIEPSDLDDTFLELISEAYEVGQGAHRKR